MNIFTTSLLAVTITCSVFSTSFIRPSYQKALPRVTTDSGSNLIAPGAKVQQVSSQFSFTEGPAPDKKGNIYFTDQPNDHIWKYDVDGKLSIFMEKSGRANGMIIDPKGNIVACTEERDELWSISKKKKVKVLLTDYEGKRLNGPNDLWMDKKGGIYFTDPYFQRPFWTRKKPDIEKQNVYYLPKGAKQPIPVVTDMQQPNGIVGTPDGKYIYISDMRGNKTYRYHMNKDGSLLDKQLLINQGSDGMTLDEQGNIYLTGRGVTVYNSEGKKIEQINVTPKWTANLCFGGKDRKTLFITASEAVYTLAMQVRGVE